jgi:hypothetical protein
MAVRKKIGRGFMAIRSLYTNNVYTYYGFLTAEDPMNK